MGGPTFERGVAAALLLAVAAAAALEGGVVRLYGGTVYALTMVVGIAWIVVRGVDPLPRLAKVGLGLLALVAIYQAAPIPEAVRALVAPGQAAWLGRVAPEWGGDLHAWLKAVAEYDVLAAIGAAGDWTFDPLAGAAATTLRQGAIAPEAWRWSLGQVLALGVVWVVGAGLGRSPAATRVVLVGLLLFCVGEAIFGLANRSGDTTGIGVKQYYMGSATGTFINRGHFAALLVLGVGCAWGLAASLFPLLSEQVRRHKARKTRSSQPPSVLEASGDRLPRLALLGFLVAVLLVAVVASQGRGPVVGLGVSALAVGGWMAWRRQERFHLGIALAVPVAGGLLAALAFGLRGAFGRFRGLFGGADASLLSRVDLWRDGLSAWTDAPVFGAGLGGWQLAHALHEVPDHLFAFQYAHNEPLQVLVETGVVGLVGFTLVSVAAGRGALRALREVPHDEGTAAGVGALVAVIAVLVQSVGDFPLHVPGVALPWALLGGIAQGSLTTPERPGARAPVIAVALVAMGLCAGAAIADAGFVGTRDDRLAERGQLWEDPDRKGNAAAVAAWGAEAAARADAQPLDPWAHAAVAEAEARLAWGAWKAGGPRPAGKSPEDHALRADLAVARAYTLRPRDPRVLLSLGQSLSLLAERAPTPDAFRERAVRMLVGAVALDGWRAEEAFAIADGLPDADLARIAAAGKGTPRAIARVHTAHGKALERRGRAAAAATAYDAAIEADGKYGPALFAAGVLARQRGDAAVSEALLRRFVAADERPGGMEGWAYVLLGELDQAEMRLRRVVAQAPSNRWAWEGLAEVAKQRGQVGDERAALQRILAIDPSHRHAKARLAALEQE